MWQRTRAPVRDAATLRRRQTCRQVSAATIATPPNTTSARQTGPFMGLEPTGNHYSIDEIHIFRIRDGQLVEHWHQFDKMSLIQQLRGSSVA